MEVNKRITSSSNPSNRFSRRSPQSLQLTIDSLKDQLNSYKGIARDKISTLYEDRNIREQQVRRGAENFLPLPSLTALTLFIQLRSPPIAVPKDYLRPPVQG